MKRIIAFAALLSVLITGSAAVLTMAGENSAVQWNLNQPVWENIKSVHNLQIENLPDLTAEVKASGSPWTATLIAGNLSPEKPDAKDDLNQYSNYDYYKINKNTENYVSFLDAGDSEFQQNILQLLHDPEIDDPELDLLKQFWKLAVQTAEEEESGVEEVRTFLDCVDAVTTLEEFNDLLSDPEFPFCPFLSCNLGAYGLDGNNLISINPNYVFVDDYEGSEIYANHGNLLTDSTLIMGYLEIIRAYLAFGEDWSKCSAVMYKLESQYGAYGPYSAQFNDAAYGSSAELMNQYTLDELEKLCSNFPITGILKKDGRDVSETFLMTSPEWLSELDNIWIEENLETLKDIAKTQIMLECLPYITSETKLNDDEFNEYLDSGKLPEKKTVDSEKFAYTAANDLNTMAQILAYLDAAYILGNEVQEELTQITEELLESYQQMIQKTDWLSDGAKTKLLEKLEKMNLNILYPENGYFSYTDLELMPAEEGGTLIENYLLLKQYRINQENAMLLQTADSSEAWFSEEGGCTQVNAFYDPLANSINILPALVNSQTYDPDGDEEYNLAVIGSIIGHEIGHAFDYDGSQYNAKGIPEVCFNEKDIEKYLELNQKLVDYLETILVTAQVKLDGSRLKLETAADINGLEAVLGIAAGIEDFEYDRFFENFAKLFASIAPQEIALYMIEVDTHAPGYIRTNVSAQMQDIFYDTFEITDGDGMYLAPEERILFWN